MAITVKEVLASLTDDQRTILYLAFENEIAHFIELPGNQYVGVNCKQIQNCLPEIEAGLWSVGKLVKNHD